MKHFYLHLLFLIFCCSIHQINGQSFDQSTLDFDGFDDVNGVTSLMYGPDGRLYVAEYPGMIKILTVQRNSSTDYVVTDIEELDGIQTMEDHNDDGTIHNSTSRETTGLTVVGTAQNPVIYVASSDFRIGAGSGGGNGDVGLDTNSGVITRFSWDGASWDVVDLVRGLPRSEENHATNGLEFVTINGNDYLIVASGGITNAGSPSTNFVYTCEYALSGAVLSVDLTALNALTPSVDSNGRSYIYDLPTLDDPTRANANGITDPDVAGYDGIDINDPWGGNDGLNQAMIVSDGPVQIFSPGYRNAYDLVVTESGAVYVTDNGANGGWGGLPANEGLSGTVTNDYDSTEPGSNDTAKYGEEVNNEDHLQLVTTDIQNYVFGSLYGGHPNPTRANPNGAGLYTDDDTNQVFRTLKYDPSSPGVGFTDDASIALPANWPPVSTANAVEGDWRGPGISNPDGPDDDPVTIWDTNTNGIDEYTATNFGGAMQGNLIAGKNSGTLHRVELNGSGTLDQLTEGFLSGIGGNALGVTCNSDNEVFPGTIWAGTLNAKIVVFEPVDFVFCLDPSDPAYNPLLDYDTDGYTNQDEEDNGTDSCNGGSQPTDFDKSSGGTLISDINDTDDDFDGIPDGSDSFQLGDHTQAGSDAFMLPISNDLFNDQQGLGGIFGLGMTGLMNNGDTGNNWLDWIDYPDDSPYPDDVLGGAPGIMTSHMTSGTANGGANTQEKGYQYGVQVDNTTGIFTVTGGMNGFTGPNRLYGNTAAVGGELGFFIGDGTQSNFIKFVVTTDGFTALQEIGDVPQTPVTFTLPTIDRPSAGILFHFVVDPATGNVDLEYQIDGGTILQLGSITAQGSILTALQDPTEDLAVGFIGTSGTANVELEGSWDFLNVVQEEPYKILTLPDIVRQTNAIGESLDLDAYFGDNGGAGNLVYTVANTNPSIGASISGNQLLLSFTPNPAIATITIRATDLDDLFVEQSFQVEVSSALYRINAGGLEITHNGDVFTADANFVGGGEFTNTSATVSPLFQSEHNSAAQFFSYNLPVSNGDYEVNLYFAEIYWGATGGGSGGTAKRVFDVDAEGVKLLDDYDIYADVGPQTEVIKTFQISVSDGELNLDFDAATDGVNQPKISAIEILGIAQYPPIVVDPIVNQNNLVDDVITPFEVVASGGNPSANFDFNISGQPEGIVIDAGTGFISGTISSNAVIGGPNNDGQHQVTVAVSKLGSTQETINFNWTITGPLVIADIDDQQSQVGTTISLQTVASGGDTNEPIVYSINGEPLGLTIDSGNGEISGTIDSSAFTGGPNSDGIHQVTVTASRLGSTDAITDFVWTVTNAPIALFRVNAGGPELIYNGETFSADSNFIGGKTFENSSATVSPMFQTERSADPPSFEYAFNVPNGEYDVVLYFAELYHGATGGGSGGTNKRVFDVEGEGIKLLDDYDIYADVGPQTEVSKTFSVSVSDGELNLLFDAEGSDGVDQPKVAAIEIFSLAQYPDIVVDAIVDQNNLVDDEISTLGVSASGGNPAASFTYEISGEPDGIFINPTNGLIYGTIASTAVVGGPAENGIHTVTITVSKQGSFTVDINFNWVITGPQLPFTIATIANQESSIGSTVSLFANAIGGNTGQPIVYSISNQPAGLDINMNTGEITGTINPAALTGGTNGDGIHQVTVTADRLGSTSIQGQFVWIVNLGWVDLDENENYTARHECSFVQAGDKFYLMGGRENSTTIDVYDYNNDTWNSIQDSAPFEFNHFQAREYQGLIWVIGAFKDNSFPTETPADHIWIFDPSMEQWIQGPDIPDARKRGSTGLVLYNDKFYVIGGNTLGHSGGYVSWFDEFDPQTGEWTVLNDSPRERDHFHSEVIGDKLYAVGGRLSGGPGGSLKPVIAEVDVYNFSSGEWATLPASENLPTPRAAATVGHLNGRLLVAGGEVNNEMVYGMNEDGALNITEAYDPTDGTWIRLPDLNFERHGTQALVSGTGMFVIAGSPLKGGGSQKNMEYYGENNPTDSPIVASQLSVPNLVAVASEGNSSFDIEVINGSTGIFVTSMEITGENASDFSIVSGEITNGLLLSESTHTINIALAGTGDNRTASLTINYGNSQTEVIGLTNSPLVSPGDQSNFIGDDVSLQIVVVNDGNTYTFNSSDLPEGLSVDETTGLISGTVTGSIANSPYTSRVGIVDTSSSLEVSFVNFQWEVIDPTIITLQDIQDQTNYIGDTVLFTASASGGDEAFPMVYSISGEPLGVSIDDATGEISGIIDLSAASGGPNSDGIHQVTVIASRLGSTDAITNFAWTISDVPVALFRINSGGPEITHNGEIFEADTNFIGGKTFENSSATVSQMFQTERSADPPSFEYAFNVPNGEYDVVLYFAEIYHGANGGGSGGTDKRVFDVEGEGIKLLDDYDIYADVGPQTEVSKSFTINVNDGELNLLFDAEGSDGVDQPKVAAIEIFNAIQYPDIIVDAIVDQNNVVDDEISTLGVGASGGNPVANFTYGISGEPEGIFIEPTNGLIYGTIGTNAVVGGPNGDGVHVVIITVDKPGSQQEIVNFNWTITGPPVPFSISNISNQSNSIGDTINLFASAIGGDTSQPISYGIEEAPEGLTIDSVTGEISGQILGDAENGGPNGDGIHQVTVTASRLGSSDGETIFQWEVSGLSCTWNSLADNNFKRYQTRNEIIDDKIYVMGGWSQGIVENDLLDIYDITNDSWTPGANLLFAVTHMGSVVVDQEIWLIGGFLEDGLTNQVQIYNTQTNSWSYGPALPKAVGSGDATILNNKIHFIGGLDLDRQTDVGTHYVLDLDNVAAGWNGAAELIHPRNHIAVEIIDGKIYAMGGQTGHDGPNQTVGFVEMYNPLDDTWTVLSSLPFPRSHFEPGTVVHNDKIIIVGGKVGAGSFNDDITEYDPILDQWTDICQLPTNRMAPMAHVHNDQLIVSGGGINSTSNLTNATDWIQLEPSLPKFPPIIVEAIANQTHAISELIIPISVVASGGNPDVDFTYLINGQPDGINIDPITGVINGTLANDATSGGIDGLYQVTVTVEKNESISVAMDFTWIVTGPFAIENIEDQSNVVGETVGFFALAHGGDTGQPITYIINGAPPSISIDSNTGEISGIISQDAFDGGTNGDGIYNVTVTASRSNSLDVEEFFVWNVTPTPLSIEFVYNQLGSPSEDVSLQLTASGGDPGESFLYSMSDAPPSLSINPNTGEITGLLQAIDLTSGPDGNGLYSVTVNVAKNSSISESSQFSWFITDQAWTDNNDMENYTARHESSFVQVGEKFLLLSGRETESVDEFDYQTNSWIAGAGASNGFFNHYQGVVYEGYVWAICGLDGKSLSGESPMEYVYLYDPINHNWIQGDTIPVDRRRGSTGAVLHNDKFYVVGGNTNGHGGGYVSWFDEYDPRTGIWTTLPDAPRPRDHFQAVVANDKLYLVGGSITDLPNKTLVQEIDVYDFGTGTWTSLDASENIPTPRDAPINGLFNGDILVMGGQTYGDQVYGTAIDGNLNIVEAFDVSTNTWYRMPDMVNAHRASQAIISNGNIFITAGQPFGGINQKNLEYYGDFTPTGLPLISSSLVGPTEFGVASGLNRTLSLDVEGGNTGIYIESIQISGSSSNEFSVVNGNNGHLFVKSGSTLDIELSVAPSPDVLNAVLVITYNGGQTINVNLSNSDLINPGDQSNFIGDTVSLQIDVVDDGSIYSFTTSDLPEGLSINETTGLISGTVTGAIIDSPYTSRVGIVDTSTSLEVSFVNFQWEVIDPNIITLQDIPDQVNFVTDTVLFSASAIGGDEAFAMVYSISGEPLGISIDDASGEISGTIDLSAASGGPNSDGIYTVTVTASRVGTSDVQTQFTWTVSELSLTTLINSGGSLLSYDGEDWIADQYGSVSNSYTRFELGNIGGTENDELYKSQNFSPDDGTLIYEIPVVSGAYDVNLHFAELYYFQVGRRVFDIDIEGSQVQVPNYDVFVAAGGRFKAKVESYPGVVVTDGFLTITLTTVTKNAIISGIEIVPPAAPVDLIPLVDAGLDQEITLPTNSVILNGIATDDGTITAYQWTQESGPSAATLAGDTTADLTASDLVVGSYVFRLTVTDNILQTAFDELTITVTDPNATIVPVVLAGDDQQVTLPTNSTVLNGSASDPDGGTITAYQWTQESGPNTASLSGDTTADLTASALVEGSYVFRLTATDDDAETSFDDVTVTVSVPSITTLINSGGPLLSYAGEDWIADQYGSVSNSYTRFELGNIGNTENDELYKSQNFSPDGGTLVYEVPITNGSYDLNLHFAELYYFQPGRRVFDIDVEGGQAQVSNYDVYVAAGGRFKAKVESYAGVLVTDGFLTITLTTVTKNTIISGIEILPAAVPVDLLPVVNTGLDQEITLPTNSIVLNGMATDDGTITAYQWTQESGPSAATLTGDTTADLTVNELIAGSYVFRLTATDDIVQTSFDEVMVTVIDPNVTIVPVVLAGDDQQLTLPINSLVLNGSATDPDGGTILTYEWTQESGPNTASLSGDTTANLTASGLVEGSYVFRLTATDDDAEISFDDVTVIVSVPSQTTRINSGGPAYTNDGDDWFIDQYGSETNSYVRNELGNIGNTENDELYKSQNFSPNDGILVYEIPVTDGAYDVDLHFAELYYFQPGRRVFDIDVEGSQVQIPNYDVYVAAGGRFKAKVESYSNINVTDGFLTITLTTVTKAAIISGIEVLASSGGGGTTKGANTIVETDPETAAAANLEIPAVRMILYPNPATSFTNIEIPESTGASNDIYLFDMNGRIVRTYTTDVGVTTQHELDLRGLPIGIYTIHVMSEGKVIYSQKLIIKE